MADRPSFADAQDVPAVLAQLAGYASKCWDSPGAAGVFHPEEAERAVDAAIERLEEITPRIKIPRPIDRDPEFWHGLTVWGKGFTAQIRDSKGETLALSLAEDVPRSTEVGHPALISAVDAIRLRDLLNIATARGFL